MRNLRVAAATAAALASTVLVGAPAAAADVPFNDGLRECVNVALSQDPADPITEEQAAEIEELVCRNGTFTGLEGMESMTSLTTLDISGGQVTDLRPLRDLPELTSVTAEDMHRTLPTVPVGTTVETVVFGPDPAANPIKLKDPVDDALTVDPVTQDWTFHKPFTAAPDRPAISWQVTGYAHWEMPGIPENKIHYEFSGDIYEDAVYVLPTISAHPADATVVEGEPASFAASATSNDPAMSVQWQTSGDDGATWDDEPGATETTWTIASTTLAQNGMLVRAVFTNGAGSTPTHAATLTVTPALSAPVFVTQPSDQTVVEGGTVRFTADFVSDAEPEFSWELSRDGGTTWEVAVVDGEEATTPGPAGLAAGGAEAVDAAAETYTAFLSIENVTLDLDGTWVRLTVSNPAGSATSDPATLTVTAAPVDPTPEPSPSPSAGVGPQLAVSGGPTMAIAAVGAALLLLGGAVVATRRRLAA